jgi:hypothetical protein
VCKITGRSQNFHDKNFLPDFLLSGNKKNSRIFSPISTRGDTFPFNHHPQYPGFASRRKMTDRDQLMALISPRSQNRAKFEEHIMPANALWKRSGSLFWDRPPLAPDQSGFSVSFPS